MKSRVYFENADVGGTTIDITKGTVFLYGRICDDANNCLPADQCYTISDTFDVDSRDCWTVFDTTPWIGSGDYGWDSWAGLLDPLTGVFDFDTANSQLDYDASGLGESMSGLAVYKYVNVDSSGFSITVDFSNADPLDQDPEHFEVGLGENADVLSVDTGNVGKHISTALSYSSGDGKTYCTIDYSSTGVSTDGVMSADCSGQSSPSIRLNVLDKAVSGEYNIGAGWNPIPLTQGAMPTDQDFTDTKNLILSMIESGSTTSVSIDNITVTGITASAPKPEVPPMEAGQSGDWNDPCTWGDCEGDIPGSGDSVIISGSTVTIVEGGDIDPGILDVSIEGDGVLKQTNNDTQTITGTLTIGSDANGAGTLTHEDNGQLSNSTTPTYKIDFSVANIDIKANGTVNANYLGSSGGLKKCNGDPSNGCEGWGTGKGRYTNKTCYGTPCGNAGAGGAHEGDGGDSNRSNSYGGTGYCNENDPSSVGSGGSGTADRNGGDGGGLIIFDASETVTINGTITAIGSNYTGGTCINSATSAGGGGGGAVKIVADIIAGTPAAFTVRGGDGCATGDFGDAQGGGGGGGSIYLGYTTSNDIGSGDVSVIGGSGNEAAQYGGHDGEDGAFVTAVIP